MERVTKALIVWSRKKISNRHKKLLTLQNQLQNFMNQPNYNYDRVEASKFKDEIRRTWTQEEQYWALRSRIQWLKGGDKNTHFFHASTIQRRQRNRITMLQLDDQQWIRDPPILQDMMASFFSRLYTTYGYRNYEPLLDQCNQIVTREMNDQLTTSLTMDEVRQATFQMGSTKSPWP